MIDILLYIIVIYMAQYIPDLFSMIQYWFKAKQRMKKLASVELIDKYKDL